MRFPMRIDPIWRPVLLILGGIRSRSFVDIDDHTVRFRFGVGFDETVPRGAIAAAARRSWFPLYGIGWRIGPRGVAGLIGSTAGVVEVRFDRPRRMRLAFIPLNVRAVAISLEDPDGFLQALGAPTRAGTPSASP